MKRWDVIIIGEGPAGLSAGLILGRCTRSVLVFDSREPRNWASHRLHGFLSREGICPDDLLKQAREDLRVFPNVEIRFSKVVDASRRDSGFEVATQQGERENCRKLLLATGVVDEIPPIPDAKFYFGRGVFQCPYCDGWEFRNRKIAVYGKGKRGAKLSLTLKTWSQDVILFTHGAASLPNAERAQLSKHEIPVIETPIEHLHGENGSLTRVSLVDGKAIARDALALMKSSSGLQKQEVVS